MSLYDLGPKLLGAVLFAAALALATTGLPGQAEADFCWPSWCNKTTASPCPNDSVGGSSGCTNCSGNTIPGFCQEANAAWEWCWTESCCRGTATDRSGSACFCVPTSMGACECPG